MRIVCVTIVASYFACALMNSFLPTGLTVAALLSSLALTTAPGVARAQSDQLNPPAPAMVFNESDGEASDDEDQDGVANPGIRWSGYGQFDYQRFDFFENAQDVTPETRSRVDLRRLVIQPRAYLSPTVSFHGEIEFEHGGTGSAVEYEPEEAGEFESEIEQGGEVIVENAYLQFSDSPGWRWRIGEMTIPFGMVNSHHRPGDHYTIDRSLAESSLFPGSWHDLGVSLQATHARTRYTIMLSRALDSSGFSGYGFVSGGASQRLESREANDLALTARFEYLPAPGMLLGTAVHYGDSSGNRARANLDSNATVTLAEVHFRWETARWKLRSQYTVGHLQNADRVTQANFNTFNASELGVSRTPIGSRANAFFVEAGYNIAPLFLDSLKRLDLFARFDSYDTHASTAGSITRNERYDRRAMTVGANYWPNSDVVFKGEFSRRKNGGTTANRQDYFGLSLGFNF